MMTLDQVGCQMEINYTEAAVMLFMYKHTCKK